MAALIIAPLNTQIERLTLEQITEIIGLRFASKYVEVSILNPQEISRRDNPRLFSSVGMSDIYGFSAHNFCGSPSIFDYLSETYGAQEVLALTDLPIVVLGGTTVNGRCDTVRKKAITSKFLLQGEPVNFIKRTLIALSLHETGHMQGLEDHLARLPNGKYCVMATGSLIAEEVGQTDAKSECYQLRDNQFCHNCEQHLRNTSI